MHLLNSSKQAAGCFITTRAECKTLPQVTKGYKEATCSGKVSLKSTGVHLLRVFSDICKISKLNEVLSLQQEKGSVWYSFDPKGNKYLLMFFYICSGLDCFLLGHCSRIVKNSVISVAQPLLCPLAITEEEYAIIMVFSILYPKLSH